MKKSLLYSDKVPQDNSALGALDNITNAHTIACLRQKFMQEDFSDLIERDEEFMSKALLLAEQAAQQGEVPVGALVVHEGSIIAQAYNLRETRAMPSAHAEFLAIEQAAAYLQRWRLSDCCLYVTLEPCVMCAGLIINARVGRCVYGARDPKAGAMGSVLNLAEDTRFNHQCKLRSGVCAQESSLLLKNFFKMRRKSFRK